MLDSSPIKKILPKGRSLEAKYSREVVLDYWTCLVSREASLIARKEVLTGKAKFGITGDGKELPQVAMAKVFKKGDWRSGYYRDQTFMMAIGECTVEQFFAQLYADVENDPFSGGRQMNNHFATPTIDGNGKLLNQRKGYNVSSDISSTAGQMSRALGIALASKLYRNNKKLHRNNIFSNKGNEVSFCTIGDASTSEGVFWETMNAATVMKIPLLVSVWDDGYGISVPIELQTAKSSISSAMSGFEIDETNNGIYIFKISGKDYPTLCATYEQCVDLVRKNHRPALIHVTDLTQPQGHSTSGSHERYKSKERLDWEVSNDCNVSMANFIVENNLLNKQAVEEMIVLSKEHVRECRDRAWEACLAPVKIDKQRLYDIYTSLSGKLDYTVLLSDIKSSTNAVMSEVLKNARQLRSLVYSKGLEIPTALDNFINEKMQVGKERYEPNLYSSTENAAINIPGVPAQYNDAEPLINGYEVLNKFFDSKLKEQRNILAFGEDVGYIGDVNQGFAGLQEKYGENRVFDTGIREWTIMGQAIGLSLRGFRPIAEIQYLDYLIYGLEPLTDDLATLRYRTNGIQQAPAIIRTRGHRLEGIWHAGSPLGMMIHALRGMYICVPRNMVQAIGMYNTLLKSNDPAIVVECLNGYRLKEKNPSNASEFTLPLGMPEILIDGVDISLVTYGTCVRIAQEAISLLVPLGIEVELIDVQTLLPFDMEGLIVNSLKKTNRIIFLDEDVPGGATSFMMQQVLERDGGYQYLDSAPVTITAKAHRTPFGSDGDYFTKPNAEDVYDMVLKVLKEADIKRFK